MIYIRWMYLKWFVKNKYYSKVCILQKDTLQNKLLSFIWSIYIKMDS